MPCAHPTAHTAHAALLLPALLNVPAEQGPHTRSDVGVGGASCPVPAPHSRRDWHDGA